ncbi:MAG: Hsp20/alpha crystallin family protein [Pseudomonadales bacterium]|nr:Hsp20/alpha crystallin family protein [Pseudomonadales bacterium]MCP5184022.1 Hsp20/alpha crystallin family protein [Pseudomonadales bacterium]
MTLGHIGEDFKPMQWLSDGWNALRDKAHNAITHFRDDDDKPVGAANAQTWGLLASDMIEHADHVAVRIEVPGLTRDQLKVEVQANHLVISGEKHSEAKRREGNAVITERAFGHFRRVLPLPADIDAERAKAEYKDGILAIDLPKVGTTARRSIAVD